MEILALLWYAYEEFLYWIWWAISGKELDFYEKASWAHRVFWGGLLIFILYKLST